eukprot:525438-Pelagomonas_calceolata.AAC.6
MCAKRAELVARKKAAKNSPAAWGMLAGPLYTCIASVMGGSSSCLSWATGRASEGSRDQGRCDGCRNTSFAWYGSMLCEGMPRHPGTLHETTLRCCLEVTEDSRRAPSLMSFAFKKFRFFSSAEVPGHAWPPHTTCSAPNKACMACGCENGSIQVGDGD